MRIFLTGASGFIGSHLCHNLLRHGHEVAVLTRQRDHWRISSLCQGASIVEGDLSSPDQWAEELAAFRPDAVAHLAWAGVGGTERNDPSQVMNIAWTTDLMKLASEAGATVFLGVGSQAEYGPKSGIISPDDDTAPTTLYGEVKLATCRIGAKLAEQFGMRFAWMRVFSTYGAGDHPRWMIPGLIGKLLQNERPPLTKGEQLWDFLNVDDAAAAMRIVLETPQASGIYNLGSGQAPRLRDTIETVRDLVDADLPLGWGEVPYRPDQVMHLQADVAKLQKLGWKPSIDLQTGLAACVRWYRENQWIYGSG